MMCVVFGCEFNNILKDRELNPDNKKGEHFCPPSLNFFVC